MSSLDGQYKQAITVTIRGRVQNVFFRKKTKTHAAALKVIGFVRNNADGSVTIHAEGSKKDLQKIVTESYNASQGGRVDTVEVTWLKPSHRYLDFVIL